MGNSNGRMGQSTRAPGSIRNKRDMASTPGQEALNIPVIMSREDKRAMVGVHIISCLYSNLIGTFEFSNGSKYVGKF